MTVTFPPRVNVPVPVIVDAVDPLYKTTLVGVPKLLEDKSSVAPALTVKAALTVVVAAIVVVPLLLMVRLLKAVELEPPMDCVVPLKVTVLVLAVNVPLFDQLPETVNE